MPTSALSQHAEQTRTPEPTTQPRWGSEHVPNGGRESNPLTCADTQDGGPATADAGSSAVAMETRPRSALNPLAAQDRQSRGGSQLCAETQPSQRLALVSDKPGHVAAPPPMPA